ncbi:MAG: SHOCT domain-containing protein [Candidatus Gracilibacteria bacterium]
MDAIYYFRFKSNEEFTSKVCPAPENKAPRVNKLDELKKLKELLDMKAISKAEFEAEKKKIIAESPAKYTSQKPLLQKTEIKKSSLHISDKNSWIVLGCFLLGTLIFLVIVVNKVNPGGNTQTPNTIGYTLIKDPNHSTRDLCRKELEKRIKNMSQTEIAFEDIRAYNNKYVLEGLIQKKGPIPSRKTYSQNLLNDANCLEKEKSVCHLTAQTVYNCVIPSDQNGVIIGPTVLKFDMAE